MFGRNELTRWHWEEPIPPIFSNSTEPLPDELANIVAIWRIAVILIGIPSIAYTLFLRPNGPSVVWILLPGLIGCGISIGSMLIRRYGADRRPPTVSLGNVLNMIASVSADRHNEIKKLHDSGVLSFSIARRIATENSHLIDEANRRNQEAIAGPQMRCDTTGGDSIRFDTTNIKIGFSPCIDGWYRVHVTDDRLNLMLRSGAAGHDAGLYWVIDHRQGVWGIPAAFLSQMRERIEALSDLMGNSPKPPKPEAQPKPKQT